MTCEVCGRARSTKIYDGTRACMPCAVHNDWDQSLLEAADQMLDDAARVARCGLNADWCVQAWYFGHDLWVLDQEEPGPNGEPLYLAVHCDETETDDDGNKVVTELASGDVETILHAVKTAVDFIDLRRARDLRYEVTQVEPDSFDWVATDGRVTKSGWDSDRELATAAARRACDAIRKGER